MMRSPQGGLRPGVQAAQEFFVRLKSLRFYIKKERGNGQAKGCYVPPLGKRPRNWTSWGPKARETKGKEG